MNKDRKNINDCRSNIIMEGTSMRKILLICLIFISSIALMMRTIHAQEVKGPRIVHEEEEITIFEDGKEVEKHYVGKIGDEKMAIIKDAIDKKRTFKEKDIQQPKLMFYDVQSKLVKEMDLSSDKRRGTIKESRRFYKKGEYEADLKTVKQAMVSKRGSYALIRNTTTASVDGVLAEGVVSGKIVLYDMASNLLFEKQYELGREVEDFVISDSGIVAVITVGRGDQKGESRLLYAYDKMGRVLLKYPAEDEKGHSKGKYPEASPLDRLSISANGRYLAARVDFAYEDVHTKTVYFDLEKKSSWKADRSYVVIEIFDNGMVNAEYKLKHVNFDLSKLMEK